MRKSQLALELEGSNLYNRRKNVPAQPEEVTDGKPRHLDPPNYPFNSSGSGNAYYQAKSPFYATPYISPSSNNTFPPPNIVQHVTTSSQQEQINPLPKPPRDHDPLAATHDPNIDFNTKRVTTLDTPELEAEFVKHFIEGVNIDEALNERPPSFPPPER